MKIKNDHLGFRIPSRLKKELHEIAQKEGRTLSQLCEIFLSGGVETYKKEGNKYVRRIMQKPNSSLSSSGG